MIFLRAWDVVNLIIELIVTGTALVDVEEVSLTPW
jgi:hypothetical protein